MEKVMTRKIGFLQLPIYLCCLVLLVSCDPFENRNEKPKVSDFLDNESQASPGEKSQKLFARIYFDATLSMQGFVVPDSTHYTRICPYLESVIVSGWREGKVDFFRFGEQVEPIDRSTYLQAGHADFYEQDNIYRETFIEKIIDYEDQRFGGQMETSITPEESIEIKVNNIPEEPIEVPAPTKEIKERREEDQLVVIVTDLFQDRGDINLLVAQLKEKYIKNGIEVGLFGMRSQFDGTVYDTGIGQAPLPYQGDRPFYLLVLGKYADIAHYFNRLIATDFPEGKKANTVIFSQYLVSSLISFEGVPENLIHWENLNPDSVLFDQDPRLKQFTIAKEPSFIVPRYPDSVNISTTLKYALSPHAVFFDSDTPEVSVTTKRFREGQIEENLDSQQHLEVKLELLEMELSVKFTLMPQFLNKDDICFYAVSLSPKIDDYKVPDWCLAWNMERELDGSRTLNLVNFVRDLSRVTAEMHQPKFAKFYFCVKK